MPVPRTPAPSIDIAIGAASPASLSVVRCMYCTASVPALEFAFWSGLRRLVSATCPGCDRVVTLPTSMWRRMTRPTDAASVTT